MEREFVYNWECPKCEEKSHAFCEDDDMNPFQEQVKEHFRSVHNMSESDIKQKVQGWNPKSQLYDLNGLFEQIMMEADMNQISGKEVPQIIY